MSLLRCIEMALDFKKKTEDRELLFSELQDLVISLEEKSFFGSYRGVHERLGERYNDTAPGERFFRAHLISWGCGSPLFKDMYQEASLHYSVYTNGLAETHFIDFDAVENDGRKERGTWRYEVGTPPAHIMPPKGGT